MLIDTHAHLYLEQFDDDINIVIQNAKDNDINKIFLPNIDNSTILKMSKLVKKDPDFFKPLMGLHPGSIDKNFKSGLKIVREELETGKYFGVGEVGIDLYWDKTFKKEQISAFDTQVKWAKEFDLPVIIHARDAMDLTIEIIEKNQDITLKGIFHCFTGNIDQAFRIMKTGFYMGIGGILTYKNSDLKDVVKEIPIEYLVLETDSPYLPPVPFRGKRNESAYIKYIAQKLAEIKNISLQEVEDITTKNALKIFLK
jgi:TatD DNase family protein